MTAVTAAARRGESWFALLWAVASLVAVAAALSGRGATLAVALAVGYAAEAALYRNPLDQRVAGWLATREMASVDRALFRGSVAFLGWVLMTGPPPVVVVLVAVVLATVQAAHAAYRLLSTRIRRRRRGRIAWQNLSVDGRREGPEVLPPTLPVIGWITGARVVLLTDVFVVAGLATAWLWGTQTPAVLGAALTAVGIALVCARVAVRTRLVSQLPKPAEENARLLAALLRHQPTVAVYFSGGVGTTYQLNVWLETIDRLHEPTLIIVRERHHLEAMQPTRTPVVVLSRATDVEAFRVPSVRLALYPTTVNKNNHMLRLTRMRHVFINHGDGDKAVTYSPLHRVFDEIWVAGQAACDRYLRRGEGVRPEQLVVVGRPQLAHIRRAGPDRSDGRRTVLYAPTWEGNFDGVDYSSVASMGEQVVETLLDPALDLRVLFKPHPATGKRLAAAGEALARIERRVTEAGLDHRVVDPGPESLYRAFNDADVLVADISSVVADFLASRKPYLVTNPRGAAVEQYHRDFPSTAAGGVVGPGAHELRAALADALGPDPLRERREELATYFLGEPVGDPVEHFADEVDRALERSPQTVFATSVADDEPEEADP